MCIFIRHFLSTIIDGSFPTTSTEVQSQGVVELASLNLDAMEQSSNLKDTIVEQLHDVFHVKFHGTLEVDRK
jgi:hypothetical protein